MKVVMLMDLANVTTPLSDAGESLDPIMTIRNLRNYEGFERLIGLWAFADYQQNYFQEALQRNLMAAGFQLIHAPRLRNSSQAGKSTDDGELIAHADWLLEHCETFDTVLMASGDRDFLRVAQRFMNHGKKVFLVNPEKLNASRDLLSAVDGQIDILSWLSSPSDFHATSPVRDSTPEKAPDILGRSKEDIYQLLVQEEDESGDYRRALLLVSVFEVAKMVIEIQESKKLMTGFNHLLNLMQDPISYRCGRIPYLGVDGRGVRMVPDWVESLGKSGIKSILSELVQAGLLTPVIKSEATTYVVNDRHPFALALAELETDQFVIDLD